MSIHFLKKLDLEGQSSFFSASKIFSRRGLGQNFEPQGFLYRQFLEGEICYMGKFLVPGRPLDRASWGEAGSGPIMTAMQGAKKGSTVLQKCLVFFFEATKNSKALQKLIFSIEIVASGFTGQPPDRPQAHRSRLAKGCPGNSPGTKFLEFKGA